MAFTLTEMLVALAVTVLALAVVTTVFSVTTKTAAVSAAIAEVENVARNFADQLQQDLEYCDPSQSVLAIVGRTQAAALTEEARQAGQYYRVFVGDPQLAASSGFDPRFGSPADPNVNGYSDPRADILMFFTNRPSASKAPATADHPPDPFQEKLQRGAKVSPIQVVYGHAAFDTAVGSGNTWAFADDLKHIETSNPTTQLSPLPADRWQLARRQVLLNAFTGAPFFGFLGSDYPRIWCCYSNPSSESGLAADAVQFDYVRYLQEFQPRPLNAGLPSLATLSPYGFPPYGSFTPTAPQWSAAPDQAGLIWNVLYALGASDTYHHVATVIEQPPAALQDNLGLHLLPGCVWFQVELLLPEDPRNGLDHPLSDQRRDTPRWVAVEPGQTYVFVPDTLENRQLVESQIYTSGQWAGRPLPHPNRLRDFAQVIPPSLAIAAGLPQEGDTVENRQVRMWPYGIRVTVRVFDQRGRIEEPIVRTVVHRFD
jgi:type II secretory pathway pseudopilin PulG